MLGVLLFVTGMSIMDTTSDGWGIDVAWHEKDETIIQTAMVHNIHNKT